MRAAPPLSMLANVINGGMLLLGLGLSMISVVRLIQAEAYSGLLPGLQLIGVFLLAAGRLAVFATPSKRCCDVMSGGVLLVGLGLSMISVVGLIQAEAYFGLLLGLLLGVFLLAAGGLAVFATPSGRCCYLDCVAPSDPGSHAHTLPRAWNRVNLLRQFAGGPMLMLVAIAPVANYWCALHRSQESKQSQ